MPSFAPAAMFALAVELEAAAGAASPPPGASAAAAAPFFGPFGFGAMADARARQGSAQAHSWHESEERCALARRRCRASATWESGGPGGWARPSELRG